MPGNITRSFESVDPQALTRSIDDATEAARKAEELVHSVLRNVVQRLTTGDADLQPLTLAAGVAKEADEAACLATGASREAATTAFAGNTEKAKELVHEAQAHAIHARVRANDAMSLIP